MPRPYPREFREDVVRVARQGDTSIAQIAKDFGIADSCLRNWLAAADVDERRGPGVARQESEEIRDLKKRNKLLEQENEVLRKAAAYLAQANISPK